MDVHERRVLPEGWEWKRLGDVIKYKKGRKPVTLLDEETEGSLQYLTAEYFRTGNSKNFVPKEELSKCILCSEHDIILIWDGSKAGDIFMGLNGVVASTMIKIEPEEKLLETYAHFFLKTQFQNFKEHTNGSSIPHVSKLSFDNTRIPLPPLPTQRRIVSILEKAEETKKLRAQADELTDRLLQSVFMEMFGDPVRNPKGWEIVKLSKIGEVNSGFTLNSQRSANNNNLFPYLRVANVFHNKLDLNEIKYIHLSDNEIERFLLRKNDVLIVEGHGNIEEIGRAAVWSEEISKCVHQNHLIRVRLDEKYMLPYFLSYFLNMYGDHGYFSSKSSTTSGLNTINTNKVRNVKIFLPLLPLQQKFARIVEIIEAMRQSQNQSKQQIEDLFSVLMQKAFKGKMVA